MTNSENILPISVLYVDDDRMLLEIGEIFLKEDPFLKVDTASSVEVAMQLLGSKRYDVIVSDYQMPLIDGIDFLKMAKRRKMNIPFILFTGKGREEVAMEAINNGAAFYVQKGGEPQAQFDDLIHKIKESVEKSRLEKRLERSRKVMDLLSSVTIHDLNNFVGALMMRWELVRDDFSATGKSESFEKIEDIISKMRTLLEEARKYQDIGEGHPEWVSLSNVAAACSQIYSEFVFNDETNGAMIYVDPMILKIISHNLVENSARHGEHVKNMTIGFQKLPDGKAILFYEDDGVGIPLNEKILIFNRGHGKHTGLGLWLVKQFLGVAQMEIAETGEPGKGVRFQITIPQGGYRLK